MDANYKFLYLDVIYNGRISDWGVFHYWKLPKAISTNLLKISGPHTIHDGDTKVPYAIAADDVFPLMDNLMKTYPSRGLSKEQQIYSYHLRRARYVLENVFDLLTNLFRIFLSSILLLPKSIEILTLACCTLHNFSHDKALPHNTSCWEEM